MKKVVLVCIAVVICITAYVFTQSSKTDIPSLHSWVRNTGKVIKDLGSHILPDKNALPTQSSLPADDANKPPETTTNLSQPSINWHYAPDNELPVAADPQDKQILPDLFRKRTTTPKTSVSGKVHLDDGDNFEGAEVGVEIPTQL